MTNTRLNFWRPLVDLIPLPADRILSSYDKRRQILYSILLERLILLGEASPRVCVWMKQCIYVHVSNSHSVMRLVGFLLPLLFVSTKKRDIQEAKDIFLPSAAAAMTCFWKLVHYERKYYWGCLVELRQILSIANCFFAYGHFLIRRKSTAANLRMNCDENAGPLDSYLSFFCPSAHHPPEIKATW